MPSIKLYAGEILVVECVDSKSKFTIHNNTVGYPRQVAIIDEFPNVIYRRQPAGDAKTYTFVTSKVHLPEDGEVV